MTQTPPVEGDFDVQDLLPCNCLRRLSSGRLQKEDTRKFWNLCFSRDLSRAVKVLSMPTNTLIYQDTKQYRNDPMVR